MNNYVKELVEKQLNENYNHLNEDFGKPYQMTDPVSMHDFIEAWEKDGKIDGIKVKPYCHEEMMEEILEDRELSDEFTDILKRVLMRLKEVESIDASASFGCSRSHVIFVAISSTSLGLATNPK